MKNAKKSSFFFFFMKTRTIFDITLFSYLTIKNSYIIKLNIFFFFIINIVFKNVDYKYVASSQNEKKIHSKMDRAVSRLWNTRDVSLRTPGKRKLTGNFFQKYCFIKMYENNRIDV